MIHGVYLPLTLMTGTLPGFFVSGSVGLSPFSTLLLIGVGLLLELGLAPVTFRQTTCSKCSNDLMLRSIYEIIHICTAIVHRTEG